MRLAAAYIDRGGPVRAADVATTAEIAGLRETRLVLEREREREREREKRCRGHLTADPHGVVRRPGATAFNWAHASQLGQRRD
jgi:hypothetical protein